MVTSFHNPDSNQPQHSMHSSDPLLSSLPSFTEQVRRQTDELLSRIVRANYNTQFAQAASELTEFRRATANLVSGMNDDALSDVFRKTVHLTTYDAYAPFTAKIFEKPCKASSIVDLLAPGLPDYIIRSSSTSGALRKIFPKYDQPSFTVTSSGNGGDIFDPKRGRTTLRLRHLWVDQMNIEDDENCVVKKIHICGISVMSGRNLLKLNPEHDEKRMGTFLLDQAAPYAAKFITKWRSFLLIHALFAVGSKHLETITMSSISTFVEIMGHLNLEFDVVVDCIENGTIPNLDGVEEFRHYLEPNLLPDPERAAELRSLGRPSSCPGWCEHVWPKLRSITGIASGSFASHIPLAQWYLGPNIDICPGWFGSSELLVIGSPYNPRELNLYKLAQRNIVEFLNIEKSNDSVSSVSQPWEVEVGKLYEIVVTTTNGLWRYRLGDVIEIAGFDPTDGFPIMKFVERRNVIIRFRTFTLSEKELRAVWSSTISSMPLVKIFNWTATIDERQVPSTIGFFVELAGNEVSELVSSAPDRVLDALLQLRPWISSALATQWFGKPTIRLVRPGTFSAFLEMKLEEGGGKVGNLKVPVVLPKVEYVTWFSNRVVREL